MPRAVGDFLILRAVRASGGKAVAVGDPAILAAADACARADGLLLCPEGGATLAAYKEAVRTGEVDPDEQVVLFNCATGLKYPLPEAGRTLTRTVRSTSEHCRTPKERCLLNRYSVSP